MNHFIAINVFVQKIYLVFVHMLLGEVDSVYTNVGGSAVVECLMRDRGAAGLSLCLHCVLEQEHLS